MDVADQHPQLVECAGGGEARVLRFEGTDQVGGRVHHLAAKLEERLGCTPARARQPILAGVEADAQCRVRPGPCVTEFFLERAGHGQSRCR